MKALLRRCWMIESHIRGCIAASRFCHNHVPLIGRFLSLLLDRLLLLTYGVDGTSSRINVAKLSISHPGGILLGGNGIISPGRVAVMTGVKFVGRSPIDPAYIEAVRQGCTFKLGDNVVIGAGSVLVGPLEICDNVIIAAMSLVNRSIVEPGTYVGIPARKISDEAGDEWVAHL
jgi:acetyltransferase-like isoleucine patch superfamily enzyme